MRRVGATLWASLVVLIALSASAPAAPLSASAPAPLSASAPAAPPAPYASAGPAITIYTDQLAGPAFMGLGVEFDPYDTLQPSQIDWPLITQRLDFMSPGFLRVVEPASDYFGGYDSAGDPTYRWTSPHVEELLSILSYAQSRGITVVLGDWANPLIGGDARIPADFIGDLRNTYGYTDIRYYDVMNEPNDDGTSCEFTCWEGIVKTVSAEFTRLGYDSWLALVGPDNSNSWDDTQSAQALDRTSGLDTDNPLDGDAWVTDTLQTIPGLIGAYDSHRYATIWGVENGVYGDQMRARREEISNLDAPAKPYFAGEVGLTARQTTPFAVRDPRMTPSLESLLDPSATSASTFVDSQPNITTFNYGIWMGDMMIQGIAAGLSGASAWDLDDAMHTGGGYGSENLKQWGFWNSLGGQDGYPTSDLAPRPWYYAWSVLSRAFPAGGEPLVVPGTGVPGLRVAAARIPDGRGYDLSLAIVNDSGTAHSITVAVPSVTGPLEMAQYDYFAAERPVDANDLPIPARMVQAQPASGITVQLPANGMVVMTSHGFGTVATLDQGTTMLLDDLRDWQLTYDHTRGLRFDHADPGEFNYAPSRVGTVGNRRQFLAYRAGQMTSFELKAYYATERTLRISAYGSEDGATWTPIDLASTEPAPTVGGHRMLAELLPSQPLPAGTNRLEIDLGPGTELAQVRIVAGRSGPACLASDLAAQKADSIGGVTLAAASSSILGLLGAPGVRDRHVWRYCVTGGGEVGVTFTRRGAVSLVSTTATGFRPGGIGLGTSLATLRHRYGDSGLRAVGRSWIVFSAGVVFIIRDGHVEAVALASPLLLSHDRSLLSAVKLALGSGPTTGGGPPAAP